MTITLSQPDYWLEGELSSMAGVVIEKAYAQQEGKNYGTPAGGIMCTGPYQLKSWSPGAGRQRGGQPALLESRGEAPLVKQILLKGVPETTTFTSGMITGAIQGSYASGGIPTLDQLRKSSAVKVYQGPGWATDAMIISASTGPLANVKVRQALSLALNRQSIINAVYKGAALMPKWLANPGAFGYGTAVFDRAYQASPALTQNLAEAKKLIAQAGVVGQTITIGTSSEVSSIAFETAAYQQAAVAIGLKVTLKSVSAQDFINFFTDRAGAQGHRRIPDLELRRLRRPGRAARHGRAAGRRPELRQLQRPADHLPARPGAGHGEPGSAGRAGRQGRAAGGADAAVDPDRRPDQRPVPEQRPDRRDGLVLLHVRPVGRQPRRRGLMQLAFPAPQAGDAGLASLLVASFVIFASLYLAPGSPIAALTGGRALPPSSVQCSSSVTTSNAPFLAQYWYWLDNALHGDLGISITLRENVSTLIASRIWTTAGLVLYASLIICLLGIGLGVLAGLRPGTARHQFTW